MSSGDQKLKINSTITLTDKILLNQTVRQWPSRFKYDTFNISDMKSIFLDGNPQFQALKKQLSDYNHLLRDNQIPRPSKQSFFDNLMKLMREIMVTRDRTIQKQFISRVFTWSQTANPSVGGGNRIQSKSLHQKSEEGDFRSQLQKTDLSFDNSKLQSTSFQDTFYQTNRTDHTKMEDTFDADKRVKLRDNFSLNAGDPQNINDYTYKARTIHNDVDPPQLRLRNYLRRQIIVPDENKQYKTVQTPFNRTFPSKYEITAIPVAQLIDDPSLEQLIPQDLQLATLVQEMEKQNDANEPKSEEEEVVLSLMPLVKTFTRVQVPEAQPPVNSTFKFYKPSTDVREVKMEKRWLENRHRMMSEKREDEEMLTIMSSWAKYKSRIEKEIDRKIETKLTGNRYLNCSYDQVTKRDEDDNNQSNPEDGLSLKKLNSIQYREPKIISLSSLLPEQGNTTHDIIIGDRARVKRITKNYGNILKLKPSADDDQYVTEGLSVYDRKMRSTTQNTTMQSIIIQNSSPDISNQLEELYEIKNRMAKYKINVPIQKLMQGIVTPFWDRRNKDELPHPGYGLLHNPYEEQKKSKKKSKKK